MTVRFKAILPKRLPDTFHEELVIEAHDIEQKMHADFQETVATWTEKPTFEHTVIDTGGKIAALVQTNNQIYAWINDGTPPHIIRPVRAKALKFSSVFRPKTKPGLIGSRVGSAGDAASGRYRDSSGAFTANAPDIIYTNEVQHPGTAPRKFDEAIARRYKRQMAGRVRRVMQRARLKSGHAI